MSEGKATFDLVDVVDEVEVDVPWQLVTAATPYGSIEHGYGYFDDPALSAEDYLDGSKVVRCDDPRSAADLSRSFADVIQALRPSQHAVEGSPYWRWHRR